MKPSDTVLIVPFCCESGNWDVGVCCREECSNFPQGKLTAFLSANVSEESPKDVATQMVKAASRSDADCVFLIGVDQPFLPFSAQRLYVFCCIVETERGWGANKVYPFAPNGLSWFPWNNFCFRIRNQLSLKIPFVREHGIVAPMLGISLGVAERLIVMEFNPNETFR